MKRRDFIISAASLAAAATLLPRAANAAPGTIDWFTSSDQNIIDFWTNFVKPKFEAANPGVTLNLIDGQDNAGLQAIAERALAALGTDADPQVDIFEGFDARQPVGAREKGFTEEMKEKHPNITVIGPDYDLDDQQKATQMTATVIEQHPDLAGVFGTNVFSAQGAAAAVTNAGLGGKVVIASWDATAANMENLNKGLVSQVLAQKPFDMGYLAVEFAAADAAGVTSLPKHVETGFAILDKTNENDPNFSRFVYKAN